MRLPITFIARGRLRLVIGTEEGNLVRIEGVLRDGDSAAWLDLVVRELHDGVIAADLDEVIVDIRRIEHPSSALWKCLLGWLRMAGGGVDGYRIRLRLARETWQETGADALAGVGAERLVIEAV